MENTPVQFAIDKTSIYSFLLTRIPYLVINGDIFETHEGNHFYDPIVIQTVEVLGDTIEIKKLINLFCTYEVKFGTVFHYESGEKVRIPAVATFTADKRDLYPEFGVMFIEEAATFLN